MSYEPSSYLSLILYLSEQLLKMREEGIRLFLQQLSKSQFDEDAVIAELENISSELQKVHLAIPPSTVHLQEIRDLNRQALHRVESARATEHSRPHPQNGHLNGLVSRPYDAR